MSPRTSVRASARERYLEMPGRVEALALAPEVGKGVPRKVDVGSTESLEMIAVTPLPNPPPQGGREQIAHGERHQPDLMARVRALYETSAVPVREIARLAGVTERTLYKYVQRGGWKRRYRVSPRGIAAAAARRGRHWQRAKGHEQVKGSGGRFIARAEAGHQAGKQPGKAVARGIKALDPRARAKANAACAAAAALEAEARADAERDRAMKERLKGWAELNKALDAQYKFQEERAQRRRDGRPDDETDKVLERAYASQVACVADYLEMLLSEAPLTAFMPSSLVTATPMRE